MVNVESILGINQSIVASNVDVEPAMRYQTSLRIADRRLVPYDLIPTAGEALGRG